MSFPCFWGWYSLQNTRLCEKIPFFVRMFLLSRCLKYPKKVGFLVRSWTSSDLIMFLNNKILIVEQLLSNAKPYTVITRTQTYQTISTNYICIITTKDDPIPPANDQLTSDLQGPIASDWFRWPLYRILLQILRFNVTLRFFRTAAGPKNKCLETWEKWGFTTPPHVSP